MITGFLTNGKEFYMMWKVNVLASLNPFALLNGDVKFWAVAIRSKQCRYFRSNHLVILRVSPLTILQVIWKFEEKMITGFFDKCDKIYMAYESHSENVVL